MKRLLLVITLLVLGTAAFGFLQHAGEAARVKATQFEKQQVETTSQLVALENTRDSIRASVENLAAERQEMQMKPRLSHALTEWLLSNGSNQISGQAVTDLKKELGLNWNTTGDFVWVSKESVSQLRVAALTNGSLTQTVCSLLAISPEERAAVEGTIQRIAAGSGHWFRAHLRRVEPAGDIVAQYEFPAAFTQSQNMSDAVITGFTAALGDERGRLFLQYADGPLKREIGLTSDLETTLIVRRSAGTETAGFTYEFRRSISEDSRPVQGPRAGEVFGHTLEGLERDKRRLAEIKRQQDTEMKRQQDIVDLGLQSSQESSQGAVTAESFPQLLLPVFPGGWREVAEREGFALPESFQKPVVVH